MSRRGEERRHVRGVLGKDPYQKASRRNAPLHAYAWYARHVPIDRTGRI